MKVHLFSHVRPRTEGDVTSLRVVRPVREIGVAFGNVSQGRNATDGAGVEQQALRWRQVVLLARHVTAESIRRTVRSLIG